MGIMVYSLLWVNQDLYPQPQGRVLGVRVNPKPLNGVGFDSGLG